MTSAEWNYDARIVERKHGPVAERIIAKALKIVIRETWRTFENDKRREKNTDIHFLMGTEFVLISEPLIKL